MLLQVVFCGPFEHHSNLLPWRDMGAEVISIQETEDGLVDMEHLKHELKVVTSLVCIHVMTLEVNLRVLRSHILHQYICQKSIFALALHTMLR